MIGTREFQQKVYDDWLLAGLSIPDEYKWLTVKFEKYSKYGIPTKTKGKCFRKVDPITGEVLE